MPECMAVQPAAVVVVFVLVIVIVMIVFVHVLRSIEMFVNVLVIVTLFGIRCHGDPPFGR